METTRSSSNLEQVVSHLLSSTACASPPITMIACEGFLPLTVQCGGTSYINVIEAYYGRTNSLT